MKLLRGVNVKRLKKYNVGGVNMASSEELLVTLGLNANGFDKTLKNVKNDLKRAEQEFKTTEKTMGGFEKTAKGLSDKINSLSKVLDAQKSVLKQYKTEIETTSNKLKDQVTAQNSLKTKLDETKRKYEESKRVIGENATETKKLESQVKQLENQFDRGQRSINKSVEELKNLESQSRQTEVKIDGLEREIDQLQTEVNSFNTNKMENEFTSMSNKIKTSLKGVETSLKSVGQTMSNVGNGIRNAGMVMSATISAPLMLLGKNMLSLGSDAQEMQNKFDVVFKTTANEVESWSNKLSKAIGRSNLEIKTAISNSADLMIGMGMSEDQAFDLSSQFIELAYDLASFNNVNDSTAIEAMTKAMMGETEMAKQLGVNLSIATMENNEYVKSLGKSWNKLTQSEKAQAYLNEAMKQSTNAIGDAERSSDSYANQLKRVKGQLEDLGAEMGQILIPIATKVVSAFSKLIEKFSGLSDGTKQAILVFMGLGVIIPPLLITIGLLISSVGTITTAIGTFAGILAGLSAPVIGVIAGVSAIVLALLTCKDTFLEMLPPVEEIKTKFIEFSSSVKGSFEDLWKLCQDVWQNVGKPIFDGVASIVGTVVAFVIELLPTIADIWNTTVDIIKKVYETVLKPVFGFVGEIVQDVAKLFADKMPMIVETVSSAWDMIKNIWENVLKPVFDMIGVVISALIEVIRPLWNSFVSIISSAFDIVCNIWNNVLKPVINAISSVIGSVVSAVSGFMGTFKSVISGAMNFVLTPIRAVISAFESIMNVGSSVVGWITDKFSKIFKSSVIVDVEFGNVANMDQLKQRYDVEQFDHMQYDAGIYTASSPLSRSITSGLKEQDQTTGILNNILKAVSNPNETTNGGLNITIENFINNREQDIENLCRELEFYRKRISY